MLYAITIMIVLLLSSVTMYYVCKIQLLFFKYKIQITFLNWAAWKQQ